MSGGWRERERGAEATVGFSDHQEVLWLRHHFGDIFVNCLKCAEREEGAAKSLFP